MKQIHKAGMVMALSLMAANAWADGTLDAVKKKGFVQCGVGDGLPGFSNPDAKGTWTGLDVDVCRAVAAAVLGDASKVKYVSLTAKERFTALQSGEVDLLSRNTTWTLTRDGSLGLTFAGVNYYDGQGFLVKQSLGVKSAKELDGAAVCIQSGTTTELNLADYFRANGGMKYTPVVFDTSDQTVKGFEAGRCDVLTSGSVPALCPQDQAHQARGSRGAAGGHLQGAAGPAVRQGDDQWFKVVRWSLNAMLNAEEAGVTSANVDEMLKSTNPDIRRLLGLEEPRDCAGAG
jgi:general L-amino acid transport system substrate-binding protein